MRGPARLLAAAGAVIVLGAAAAGCSEDADGRRAALEGVARGGAVPAYTQAAAAAATLDERLRAFCRQPSAATLRRARTAWGGARAAWARADAFGIGPAADRRSADLIDYAPVDPARVDAVLSGGIPLTPESVRALSSASRGLGGVERALFARSTPDGLASARRCAYLASVAAVVREEAAAVRTAWQEGADGEPAYAARLAGDGPGAEEPQDALDMLVSRQVALLEDIVDLRLNAGLEVEGRGERATVMGDGPGGRGAADIADRLRGIRNAYAAEGGTEGLGDLLDDREPGARDRILARLDAAIAAADAVDGPLADGGDATRALQLKARLVKIAMATEVVSLLGVTLGFSDNDGDSGP